jgi:hypothetical protein
MMEGFDLLIAFVFLTFCGVTVGSVFALVAWLRVISEWGITGRRNVPAALWALTASVCLDLVAYPVVLKVPERWQDHQFLGAGLVKVLWLCFLIAGFGCVIATLQLLRRYSGPGEGTLRTGSRVLLIVYVAGLSSIVYLLMSQN